MSRLTIKDVLISLKRLGETKDEGLLGRAIGPANGNNLNKPPFGKAWGGTANPRNLQFGLKVSF